MKRDSKINTMEAFKPNTLEVLQVGVQPKVLSRTKKWQHVFFVFFFRKSDVKTPLSRACSISCDSTQHANGWPFFSTALVLVLVPGPVLAFAPLLSFPTSGIGSSFGA